MDIPDVMARLKRIAKLSEAFQVTTFKGHRVNNDGSRRVVSIEVWDGGEAAGRRRYRIVACDEDGRIARGEPRETVEAAIAATQWFKLDPEFVPNPSRQANPEFPKFHHSGVQ